MTIGRTQAKHGYQLKGEFEEATGRLWPLNIGQVYSSLQRLERDDLVVVAAEGNDRRSYRITADGLAFLRCRAELDWLDLVEARSESRDGTTPGKALS